MPQVERTGGLEERSLTMCDYSLHNVKSRAARVGDKLTTRNFGTGTRGFAAQEDTTMAVCVLPGTELAFSGRSHARRPDSLAWARAEWPTRRQSFGRSTRT